MNESESNNENDDDNNKNNENKNKNEDDDDYEIKQINDYFKMIDESISFEEQINLLKIMDDINRYWHTSYCDDKVLNLKIFKLKYAFLTNELDEKLFEEIFGHTFVTLANKVLTTTNKEENRIIVEDIKKNMDKLYEHDGFYNFMIQPEDKCVDLLDAATIILEFNETI